MMTLPALILGVLLSLTLLERGEFGPLLAHDEAQGKHPEVSVAGFATFEVDGEAFLGYVHTGRERATVEGTVTTICADETGTYGGTWTFSALGRTSFLMPTEPLLYPATYPRDCMVYLVMRPTRRGHVWLDLYTYRVP
jgi:hypothetical protein